MANLNKVLLIGNLTRDPELRYTTNGIAVANLRLAVNHRYKDRSGELKEDTCFITVTAWDKQAETCNQYLRKGRLVFVEGRLQSRSWETNDGQKRSTIDVRAERIQFLDSKDVHKAASNVQEQSPMEREQQAPAPVAPEGGELKPEEMAWEEE